MIENGKIRLVAFDLDGTLTQHKTPLGQASRRVLDELRKRYKLLMVGAGSCERIFHQMEHYPIDILGNYGMQYGIYNPGTCQLDIVRDEHIPCDRESVEKRVGQLRVKYGFTDFVGDSVEFHDSGCVTIPLLGTKPAADDKLAFDPDRLRRRKIYGDVCGMFPDFNVFVGGTSSFDMAPEPYNKYYALSEYCRKEGYAHDEVVFFGDDYGAGGNDESIYQSDFHFIKVDDYRKFPEMAATLL